MHDETADQQPKAAGLERHVQSILLAVITAAVLYSGTFIVGANTQIAVLTSEVAALRAQLATMQSNYIGRDEYRDHETRLRSLEATRRAQ